MATPVNIGKQILPMVNDHEIMAMLWTYAQDRITQLHDLMDGAKDWDQVCRYQGSILELRRIPKLREEVLQALKS